MEIIKILNCTLETALSFLFIALLSKRRFKNLLALVLTITIAAAVGYLFVGAVLPIKALVSLAVMISGSLIVFKDDPERLTAYSLIALYITYISDLIFGSLAAVILNKQFSEAMLPHSAERLIIKIFFAALLRIVYLILRKKDDNTPRKFWTLFGMVIFGFLLVTVIFSGAYHYSAIATSKENMLVVAVIALIFLTASFAVVYFFSEICAAFQREQRLLLLETNYSYFQEQLVLQNENAQILKKIRHDIINHLTNVRSLISLNEIGEAVRLLDETALKTENTVLDIVNTGDCIADAVIMSKSALCRSKNIAFDYKIESADNFPISAEEMSSLISNLLDNAIEAAEQAPNPYVVLDIFTHNAYHVIRVENSTDHKEPTVNKNFLQTTKPNKLQHGYGMKIIEDIAEKYEGNFSWKYNDGSFIGTVFIKRNNSLTADQKKYVPNNRT